MKWLAIPGIIVIGACVHAQGDPMDDPEHAVAAVRDALAAQPACIAVPQQSVRRTDDAIIADGFRRSDGSIAFRQELVRALDVFVEIGFLTAETRNDEHSRSGVARVYTVTSAGRPYYRYLLAEPPGTRSTGFCYGRKELIETVEITPVHRGPCSTSRRVVFTYRYVDFPPWIEDQRIRSAFPDRLGMRDAGVVRQAEMPLMLEPEGWTPGSFDYIHNLCTPIRRRN
jgi:hypothetical protein